MGYQRTPAHYTASAAYHGGDPVWIRPANRQFRRMNPDGGGSLGGGSQVRIPYQVVARKKLPPAHRWSLRGLGAGEESISLLSQLPGLISAATSAGKAIYDVRQQQMDTQRSRAQAEDAKRAADAANAVAAATAASTAIDQGSVSAGHGRSLGTPLIVGGAIVAGLALIFLLRR